MKKAYIFAGVVEHPAVNQRYYDGRTFWPVGGNAWMRYPQRVSCFWDGNKTPAISIERLLLGDVAQEPSAAQWKEARYNGGRISKSYFPDL